MMVSVKRVVLKEFDSVVEHMVSMCEVLITRGGKASASYK
jgi:hypothetical protein